MSVIVSYGKTHTVCTRKILEASTGKGDPRRSILNSQKGCVSSFIVVISIHSSATYSRSKEQISVYSLIYDDTAIQNNLGMADHVSIG